MRSSKIELFFEEEKFKPVLAVIKLPTGEKHITSDIRYNFDENYITVCTSKITLLSEESNSHIYFHAPEIYDRLVLDCCIHFDKGTEILHHECYNFLFKWIKKI